MTEESMDSTFAANSHAASSGHCPGHAMVWSGRKKWYGIWNGSSMEWKI